MNIYVAFLVFIITYLVAKEIQKGSRDPIKEAPLIIHLLAISLNDIHALTNGP
jgi:hypothetical protein